MKTRDKYILATIGVVIFILLSVMIINFSRESKEYIVGTDYKSEMRDENSENIYEEYYEEDETGYVTVFVSGEVLTPKVIELEKGKRLIDAVEMCGGLTEKADLNAVNLAVVLEEEGHYIIPSTDDTSTKANYELNQGNQNTTSSNLININSADIETLKTLPGIGDTLGQRIIDKREELGKFNSVEQLREVSGIGDKKFSEIKDKVTIN